MMIKSNSLKTNTLLKDNKGMTLIELVTAMLIFFIILTSLSIILVHGSRLYIRAKEFSETNFLLDNLSKELLADLEDANGASVSDSQITIQTSSGTIYYGIGSGEYSGMVCRGGLPVFGSSFYKGKTALLEYYDESMNKLTGAVPGKFFVRLTIMYDGEVFAYRDYGAAPQAMNQYY